MPHHGAGAALEDASQAIGLVSASRTSATKAARRAWSARSVSSCRRWAISLPLIRKLISQVNIKSNTDHRDRYHNGAPRRRWKSSADSALALRTCLICSCIRAELLLTVVFRPMRRVAAALVCRRGQGERLASPFGAGSDSPSAVR